MNEDIEEALEALLAKVRLTPYGDTFHVHIDDFNHTVAKLTRAMARLSEQRDRKIYTNKQWDDGGVIADDAEIIEILTGDAK